MKRWVRAAILYGLFIVLFLVLIFVGEKIGDIIFGVRSCACEVNEYVATSTKKSVERFVEKHKAQKPDQLLSLLRDEFPFLKTISAFYRPPNHIDFFMHTYMLRMIINNSFVLISNGLLIDRNVFAANRIDSLKRVSLADELIKGQHVQEPCLDLLKQIDFDRLKQYNIVFRSQDEILLQDTEQRRFTIVSDAEAILDYSLLERCAELKKELDMRGSFKSANKKWIADVRFEKQIVVRANREIDG